MTIERLKPKWPRHLEFDAANVRKLPLPTQGQRVIWDTKQTGLSILLSKSTRTYRATYIISADKEHPKAGKAITKKIGRVGEMSIQDARKTVETYRGIANDGVDPAKPKPRKLTFGEVATEFINQYCKPNQRTWDQTERLLNVNCAALWTHPIDTLTKAQIKKVCNDFASEGHPYKAANTHATVKAMLGWAEDEDLIRTNVLLGATTAYEQRTRDRVYSDDDIKAIWKAADKLIPVEGAYFKLLLLLAPRKTALALMQRSHLVESANDPDNPDTWVTPFELTKSKKRQRDPNKKKRVYVTPLPALAQRILKGLPKGNGADALVFPGLNIRHTKAGSPTFNSGNMIARLKKAGAPRDFFPHACRHTIATWFEDEGEGEWECGLILNHAGSGVTAGYRHGTSFKLKLELLERWAAHVEALITPAEGVTVLR
jgi:integrase